MAQALGQACANGLPRLDAQMLLLHLLQRDSHDRAWLLAHDDHVLPAEQAAGYLRLCHQRLQGLPLAYLTGTRDFHGLRLRVDARVLDPRPDTETLVDWALELLPLEANGRVLDLGTGSGAVALAIARQRPGLAVWATDSSAEALAVAADNSDRLGLRLTLRQGNWLAAVSGECFDLIVSNPPYVAAGDPHLQALRHEPLRALVSGADGLDDLRRICRQAPDVLKRGGHLLLEHGWQQGAAVRGFLSRAGFLEVQTRLDLGGLDRCSGGLWAG